MVAGCGGILADLHDNVGYLIDIRDRLARFVERSGGFRGRANSYIALQARRRVSECRLGNRWRWGASRRFRGRWFVQVGAPGSGAGRCQDRCCRSGSGCPAWSRHHIDFP